MRSIIASRVVALLVLVAGSAFLQSQTFADPITRKEEINLSTFVPVGTLREEHTLRQYTIRIYQDTSSLAHGSFEIFQNGRRVYAEKDGKFWIGGTDEEKAYLTPIGKDITGNGVPNLVVSSWSGGAHCCFDSYVFEIGEKFRKIAELHGEHSGCEFVDLDGDGILEVVTRDPTFAYWRASYAESPQPQVILHYRNGAYRLAGDLMRKPAPSPSGIAARALQIQNTQWGGPCLAAEDYLEGVRCLAKLYGGKGDAPCRMTAYPCPPTDLWRTMLELIYTGHASLAWQFLDMAWPLGIQGKHEFLSDFRARLTRSSYWPEIQGLLELPMGQAGKEIADVNPLSRGKKATGVPQQRTAPRAEEISLVKEGGVYKLPVEINGVLTLHFILDTGASDVQIPADVALTLIRAGTIQSSDFLPGRTYTLADGTTVKSPRFILRSLKIGTHLVTQVPASIGDLFGALLLGQSVLERLGIWSMDSQRRVLVLGPATRRDEPFLAQGSSPQPSTSPRPVPQPSDTAPGQTYVRQMMTYAMANEGMGNEDAILATKRRIEALKPKRLADPQARKQARAANERGLQYITNGQMEEAAQAFQAAYESDPTDVEIINNLGDVYRRLSNLEAAESLLLRALVFAPGRANAWANLGAIYAKQGQRSAAVACFANAYRFSKNQDATRQFLQQWAEGEDTEVREAAQQTLQLPLVQAGKNEKH